MNVNNKISLFKSYIDTIPVIEISVIDFCANVISGDYKNEVLAIRDLNGKSERDRIKATLPAVTISGTFSKRCNSGLLQHSGIICLDFDEKKNPDAKDWTAVRDRIGEIGEILFCALSVSGRGCFAIVPITWPDKHRLHFEALRRDFIKHIGFEPDNTPDISRLRGISYDPDATWNEKAECYRRIYCPQQQQRNNSLPVHGSTFEKIKEWVNKRQTFTKGTRNVWVMDFAAACHRLGIAQTDCKKELLQFVSTGFTEKEIHRTIQSIYNNKLWEK